MSLIRSCRKVKNVIFGALFGVSESFFIPVRILDHVILLRNLI